MSAMQLIVRDDLSISLRAEAFEMRESALAQSGIVGRVSNAEEQTIAVAALQSIDDLLRLAEKSRKAVKEPFIAAGRDVDAKCKEFTEELIPERNRLDRIIGDFQQAEIAKAKAAEMAAKLEAESQARKEQEELAKAQTIEAREEIRERYAEQAAAQPVAVLAPPMTTGLRVKHDWDIEVLNEYDLARYHPQCVTITAKLGEIKELLRQGVKVHGIRATPIIKTQTR